MKRYEHRRIGDLTDEMAARYHEREALVFQNERYTFAEVSAEIATAAEALMAIGVQRGEHVAFG